MKVQSLIQFVEWNVLDTMYESIGLFNSNLTFQFSKYNWVTLYKTIDNLMDEFIYLG